MPQHVARNLPGRSILEDLQDDVSSGVRAAQQPQCILNHDRRFYDMGLIGSDPLGTDDATKLTDSAMNHLDGIRLRVGGNVRHVARYLIL